MQRRQVVAMRGCIKFRQGFQLIQGKILCVELGVNRARVCILLTQIPLRPGLRAIFAAPIVTLI